ncbi:substrate-binding domain-containing protein [Streptomyces sp. NK08204]|uniref:substrate-binding domain-containing protein n=1 Tax=Streptomyces sp. NK08204 TaxID=2873260 RepID=UPI001CED969A|nr:substrate-binding domain-containing protein [Streptomyces sp. NK08204]
MTRPSARTTGPRLRTRRIAIALTAVLLAAGTGACGTASDGRTPVGGHSGAATIGLLLPENQATRYEAFDRPFIERRVEELCPACRVTYADAQGDPVLQRQQVNAMISRGVKVLILDAVDVKAVRPAVVEARRAGMSVVAYDRLAEGPVSAFTGQSEATVGRLQGEALLAALGPRAASARIVWLDALSPAGRPSEREKAARSVLRGRVRTISTYRPARWDAADAYALMAGAVAKLGAHRIDGVYAANDVLAGGAVSALEAAYIRPLPPVIAQDAELSAVQRVLDGRQYMTVHKRVKDEAYAAAEAAVALSRGEKVDGMAEDTVSNGTASRIPTFWAGAEPVTARTVKDTVVKDGTYTVAQICTAPYRAACVKAGLLPGRT